MASNKEAGRDDGVVRQETSKGNGRGDANGASVSENEDIGRRVEEYLTSVERELTSNRNPRLTLERSRLLGLLESYKKLCDVYERRKEVKKPAKDERTLEIYAVLYPELYQDLREKEKIKLRKNLVKGRTGGDGCTPRNFRLPTRAAVEDTRQREKERFVRLVSSAPSAFHQGTAEKHPINRRRLLLASSSSRVQPKREDAREKEKERLAKILSSDLDSNPAFKRRFGPSSAPAVKKPPNTAPPAILKISNNKREPAKVQNKPTFQLDRVDKGGGMVRRDAGRRPGVGTNQLERRNRLLSLTNKEHQHHLDVLEGRVSKKDKGVLARESSILDLTSEQQETVSRHRASSGSVSVSTQTDDRLASPPPTSMLSPRLTTEPVTEHDQTKLFSVQKEPFITSPRAKLIKDLHGVSPCLPGASPLLTLPDQGVSDEKRKRCAYAEALKAQIDEKRRLEEEKRRKELEEDEHIERRAREQQHRLKQEWEREQSLRHDWLMQKEAQEESVRQKMAELELEAKELKRRERLRRGAAMSPDGGERPCSPGGGFPSTPRQRLSPREVEQLLPQAMRDSMMTSLIMDKPRPKTLHLENNNNTLLANQNNTEVVNVEAESSPVLDEGMKQSSEESPGSNNNRPSSPVLPAVQTDSILRRSLYSSPRLELVQGEKEKDELLRGDRILTQLGVFRRELELEQERLEQRLFEQGSS